MAADPAQVARVGRNAVLARIEDEPEEWVTAVSLQVRPVRGPHHRVAEAVARSLELDRHERLTDADGVEAPAVREHVVDDRLAHEQRQERAARSYKLIVTATVGQDTASSALTVRL